MPWIQNVALSDIKKGFHINPGDNAMLIQIVDCGMEFPEPMYKFKHVAQFEFLDLEKDDFALEEEMKIKSISSKEFGNTTKASIIKPHERDCSLCCRCVS